MYVAGHHRLENSRASRVSGNCRYQDELLSEKPVKSSQPMDLVITVVTWAIAATSAIAVVYVVNRRKSPRPLPPLKPRLALFPKYLISLPASGDPTESVPAVMEKRGFRAVTLESGKRYFERGSVFGDFSIKWTKLRISEMEGRPNCLSIAYGGPVLFDTGDLWKFAKELESYLTSPE